MNKGVNFSEFIDNTEAHHRNEFQKNVEEYPFSSLARYLLLYHYKKTGHQDFELTARKTAIYFDNHYWLQFQLSQLQPGQPWNELSHQDTMSTGSKVEDSSQQHFAAASEEQFHGQQDNGEVIGDAEDIPDTQTLGAHIHSYDEIVIENVYENDTNAIVEEIEIIPGTQTLGSHIQISEDAASQINYEENQYTPHHQDEKSVPDTQTLGSHDYAEAMQATEEEHNIETIGNCEKQSHEIKESEDHTEQNFEGSTSPEEEPMVFEPMYTVDYFASQGIRIPDQILANDKLGAKMKSFTEWLRSLKKIDPDKLPGQNTLAEDIIKSAAEVSNIDTEVLTEAMAEVLIKQDKKEKAIEMYNKLSLINPSKSAYFAAKIESIKST